MRVQIAARNCEISGAVRDRTDEQLRKLARFDDRLSGAEVVFEEVRHVRKVEGILSVDGDEPVVARGEGVEFRPALDQMVDRLSRILRRRRAKAVKDHKAPPLSEVVDRDE